MNFQSIADGIDVFIGTYIVPTKLLMIALLGTGLFLTIRLGLLQLRRLKHGVLVTMGKYDKSHDPGDVTHFQALTTALSATVGVGNIAGVATALHWGGPGALFWMWVTAFFGMAVKFAEVTLALKYREVDDSPESKKMGTASGGPMYYIEKGLGPKWKPLALVSCFGLLMTTLMGSNAVQANTLTDQVENGFGIDPIFSGLASTVIVGLIIFGGIKRIGKVTSILAPAMAMIYIGGAVVILFMNAHLLFDAFSLILAEAFQPTAGLAGSGAAVFMITLEWGVKRGLFSNEAGQGSAPIAHAAAQTDEPVSEGSVALLEPLIDTLVICTITGLVLITTNAWNAQWPTKLDFSSGDATYRTFDHRGVNVEGQAPGSIEVINGVPQYTEGISQFSWHEVPITGFYTDEAMKKPFTGLLDPEKKLAVSDGVAFEALFGPAVDTGAPLTSRAFAMKLGRTGTYIVLFSVVLFAISTAISWSYYGDRCCKYLIGEKAVVPFKVIFLMFHYVGATALLAAVWKLGDRALSIAAMPNLIALLLLSGVVARETRSYFKREPWKVDRE